MTGERIPVSQLVVCEGKYDKIKLDSVIDGDIITLDGFGIFNSLEKREIIKKASRMRGVIVITDSDSAGMVIRNHINNITGNEGVSHLYIPTVKGREHRKEKASAEGLLGVEGMDAEVLRSLFEAHRSRSGRRENPFTRALLFEDGLMGRDNSARLRASLCRRLSLPEKMSVGALLSALPIVTDMEEYKKICEELKC